MAKYRVFELAEELGVESSHLVQILHQMDVRVRSHMSSVDDVMVSRLHARLERERRTGDADEADGSAGTKRRRRRKPPAVVAEAEVAEAEVAEAEVEAAEQAADAATPEIVAEDVAAAVEEEQAEPDVAEPVVSAEDVVIEAAEPGEVEEPTAEAEEPAAEAEELAPETEPAPEPAVEPEPRRDVKPSPVRSGLPEARPETVTPAASAGPGGTVRIQAEGYTTDGRKRSRREKKRKSNVDREAVQENVKKTLAAMGSGPTRRKRRDTGPTQQEVEREEREAKEEVERTTVRVNEFLTVAELADQLGTSAQEIIASSFKNLGLMVTINQRLDFDQIELICDEFSFDAVKEDAYEADLVEDQLEEEDEALLEPRAPVVTVMGHVDHGKTSLLDHLRETNVIAGESGGITQHIGAYHLELPDGRSVAFLDTPGHEAFTAMRARGAEMTDIVILVVAADDAVMPQTIEAISHAKNAGVPIVVAINKVDLPAANVVKVKQDLLAKEVILEEFGGTVLSAEVSAKTGQGMEELLEKVLLQAELLELTANPGGPARGTVVEAELDKGMGPVATVLIQSGQLKIGDDFICGLHGGRVRALLDERGKTVTEAGPSVPVRVLGIEGVPQAGDRLLTMDADRVREVVARRQQLEREKSMRRGGSVGTQLEDVFERIKAGQQATLNLVIKGDTDGSVQALSDSFERLSTSEVAVKVIHRGVGAVNERDVLLAATSEAAIIGFHVRPEPKARAAAERDGVQIRVYNVIYEAVEDVRLALEGLLEPEERDVVIGSAEVRELFRVPKAGTVAGCYVTEGTIQRNAPIRLLRDFVQIYEGKMGSLRRFKEDVREVKDGYECGIAIEGYNDIKVGDVIECFRVEQVARSLAESAAAT
ncbi:MAG: translation initiation factor IF-2 [Gemmatimonadota bacterium]